MERVAEQTATQPPSMPRVAARPLVVGLAAAAALLALYLALVSLVSQSWSHALSLLVEDRWFVVPIILGFGLQAGLFTYLRALHRSTRAPAAVTGSSAGMSAAAMVACCAHHVSDVLPLLGLSGAAIFLAEYKVPFMVLGLLSNAAGIGYLLINIRRGRRHHASNRPADALACHTPSGTEEVPG